MARVKKKATIYSLTKIDKLVLTILKDEGIELGSDADKYWAYLELKYGMGIFEINVPTVSDWLKSCNAGVKHE
jgi:hypothetical protein